MTLRQAIRRAMGEATYARLQMFRRRRANRLFAAKQTTIQLRVGDYVLSAPSNHILRGQQPRQPYRDLAIGLVAREASRKYRGDAGGCRGQYRGYGGDHGDVFTESEDPGGAERLLPGFSA